MEVRFRNYLFESRKDIHRNSDCFRNRRRTPACPPDGSNHEVDHPWFKPILSSKTNFQMSPSGQVAKSERERLEFSISFNTSLKRIPKYSLPTALPFFSVIDAPPSSEDISACTSGFETAPRMPEGRKTTCVLLCPVLRSREYPAVSCCFLSFYDHLSLSK